MSSFLSSYLNLAQYLTFSHILISILITSIMKSLGPDQSMQKFLHQVENNKLVVFCPEKHKATLVCTNILCNQTSLHCLEDTCSTCIKHQDNNCTSMQLRSLTAVVKKRRQQQKQVLKQLIQIEGRMMELIEKSRKMIEGVSGYELLDKQQIQIFTQIYANSSSSNINGKIMAYFAQKLQREKYQATQKDNQLVEKFRRQIQEITLKIIEMEKAVLEKHMRLKWSSTLRGSSINIQNRVAIQTGNDQRFILLQPVLSKMYSTKWTLNIKNLKSWVGVGICLKNKIKNANFCFLNYTDLGHGSYLISSNQYSWSHSDNQKNYSNKTSVFQFKEKDQITFEYDPNQRRLKFYKNKQNPFQLSTVDPPADDEYHACVNFTQGDEIEISE